VTEVLRGWMVRGCYEKTAPVACPVNVAIPTNAYSMFVHFLLDDRQLPDQ